MKNGKLATNLQEVDVGIIDDATCLTTDNKHDLKTDSMFCAGYLLVLVIFESYQMTNVLVH